MSFKRGFPSDFPTKLVHVIIFLANGATCTANTSERTGRFTDRTCDGDEVKTTMSREVTPCRLADIYRPFG